jgi:DNA-binding beta-propeller fold protein YncE
VTSSPDGAVAYVGRGVTDTVSMIDTSSLQLIGAPLEVGWQPEDIAGMPSQAPLGLLRGDESRIAVEAMISGAPLGQ